MKSFIVAVAIVGSVFTLGAPAFADSSDHGKHIKSEQMEAHRYHTEATVNSVGMHKMNVSHGKIPTLGWPAMTMDFGVAENVDTSKLKAGDRVMMIIEKGHDGMFQITDVKTK